MTRVDVLKTLVGKQVGVVLANGKAIGGKLVSANAAMVAIERRDQKAWAVTDQIVCFEQLEPDPPALVLDA